MEAPAEGVEQQRVRSGELRDLLRQFAEIHVQIDTPNREISADTPDWILRLRKVCHHALAIAQCDVDVDGVHAMSTELRAAYWQMRAVWPRLPAEHRVIELEPNWWADEARSGLLAMYDHPTPTSLILPLIDGGFDETDNPVTYVRLVVWLGHLGLGYGLALTYLAEALDAQSDFDSQVTAILRRAAHALQINASDSENDG